jgi:hypothetical protein
MAILKFKNPVSVHRSLASSVVRRWATGWIIRGFESREGMGLFLFATESRPVLVPTQPSIQWVPRALPLGVKLTTHLSNAEVKE